MKANQRTGYAVPIITGLFSPSHLLYPELSLHLQAQHGPNIWSSNPAGPIKGKVWPSQIPVKTLLSPRTQDQQVPEHWNCFITINQTNIKHTNMTFILLIQSSFGLTTFYSVKSFSTEWNYLCYTRFMCCNGRGRVKKKRVNNHRGK